MAGRRVLYGTMVMLVAVGVSLAGSAMLQIPVAGVPAAVPVPDPPRIGDCLLTPTFNAASTDRTGALQGLPIRRCSGPRYGEVMAVAGLFNPTSQNRADNPCSSSQSPNFLGLREEGNWILASWWSPAQALNMVIAGPDRRQRAAGQRWSACVVSVSQTGGGQLLAPYTGSMRHAFSDGRLPTAYALCGDDPRPHSTMTVPCDRPHRREFFATRTVTAPAPPAAALIAACTQIIAHFTAMADPTAGGALQITATTTDWNITPAAGGHTQYIPPGSPIPAGASGQTTCAVNATHERLLTATLIGLGDQRPPLK